MKKPMVYFYRARRGLAVEKELDRMLVRVVRQVAADEGLFPDVALTVTYVDDGDIRELNREHREIDRATDVLSFPMLDFAQGVPPEDAEEERDPDTGRLYLGDVVISVPTARAQAERYGHSFEREMAFLTAHSMLHLLGYAHEAGEAERLVMEDKQERALAALGIGR